jgi:hypothetical protein
MASAAESTSGSGQSLGEQIKNPSKSLFKKGDFINPQRETYFHAALGHL